MEFKEATFVAHSSTEVEYHVVATTSSKLLWLNSLLLELGISVPKRMPIYCDNVGTTYLCANPIFHFGWSILLLIFILWVQDYTLRVPRFAFADQLVDALTKPQSLAHLQHLCVKLGIQSKSILRGHDKENGLFESPLQSLSNPIFQ